MKIKRIGLIGHVAAGKDWFSVGEKIYFSEMTVPPCGGAMKMETTEQDINLGKMLDISGLLGK